MYYNLADLTRTSMNRYTLVCEFLQSPGTLVSVGIFLEILSLLNSHHFFVKKNTAGG